MLVNNFSAGIWRHDPGDRRLLGRRPVRHVVHAPGPRTVVDFLVSNSLLPLTSIFIEPAKVLFLNNAINHGVLTPLGTAEAAGERQVDPVPARGQPRPRAWACCWPSRSSARARPRPRPPARCIIHFVGGIHEIYFPYVLMKPKLILAMIAGGMTADLHQRGLRLRPAGPGRARARSSRCCIADARRQLRRRHPVGHRRSGRVLRRRRASCSRPTSPTTRATSPPPRRSMEADEGQEVHRLAPRCGGGTATATREIRNIVFACDAGMGSSAMGASVLRKKIHDAGHAEVTVVNKAISNLDRRRTTSWSPTRTSPTGPARRPRPPIHVSVDNFMGSPRYDEIVTWSRRASA